VSLRSRQLALAPFGVRSFRFQWGSDLLASLAFEMETLILGWYVLVETQSVVLLGIFGSLQFLGSLLAPFTGVLGDRLGSRSMLLAIRAACGVFALLIMVLGLTGTLSPLLVFATALVTGLLRPTELMMRMALVGEIIPPDRLLSAMGLSRITIDVARIAGALTGASLFAAIGLGLSYVVVSCFYVVSVALTFGIARSSSALSPGTARSSSALSPGTARSSSALSPGTARSSSALTPGIARSSAAREPGTARGSVAPTPGIAQSDAAPRIQRERKSAWQELKGGMAQVWNTPSVLAIMWLAFLVNLTAFPVTAGLLPYVAKEIYGIDEIGLGHIVSSYSFGALAGSVLMTFWGGLSNANRAMMVSMVLWYSGLALFAFIDAKWPGIVVLFCVGLFQCVAMVTSLTALLNDTDERYRARIMGVRMLAVYGLPIGLVAAGYLIRSAGFLATTLTYSLVGLAVTLAIGYRWRRSIWH
jgi:predicted MFS family arabinose efflux permease